LLERQKQLSIFNYELLPDYSDITIILQDEIIHAHKAIIFARAPGFYSWIEKNEVDGKVYLRNIKPQSFKNYLSVIYGQQNKDKSFKKLSIISHPYLNNPQNYFSRTIINLN